MIQMVSPGRTAPDIAALRKPARARRRASQRTRVSGKNAQVPAAPFRHRRSIQLAVIQRPIVTTEDRARHVLGAALSKKRGSECIGLISIVLTFVIGFVTTTFEHDYLGVSASIWQWAANIAVLITCTALIRSLVRLATTPSTEEQVDLVLQQLAIGPESDLIVDG